MATSVTIIEGQQFQLPTWGRSFWQDPNDGVLFLAFVSGNNQAAFVTSSDSGNTWGAPQEAFPVDNFFTHNNFDTEMDTDGNVHCVYRYNDSGCYTFLSKEPTGWSASGLAVRGFVDVGDTDTAKGFNGMVSVYNFFESDPGWWTAPLSFSSDTSQRAARIVVKDSTDEIKTFRVPDSGNFSSTTWSWYPGLQQGTPLEDFGFSALTKSSAGPSGGFPIFTDAGGSAFVKSPAISWSINATGIAYAGKEGAASSWSSINDFIIDGTESSPSTPLSTPKASGYLGRVPFNPNMSFGKAISDRVHPIIASIDNGKAFFNWEMYSTAFEKDILYAPSNNVFTRVAQSATRNFTSQTTNTFRVTAFDTSIGTIPFGKTFTQGGIPVPTKSINTLFTPGTKSDISHGDTPRIHKIYFQTTDEAGQQNISRILCKTQDEGTNDVQTKFFFSSLRHASSGIRSFAPAGLEYTGGSGSILNWNGFKALRHPTLPGVGKTKKEIVVTAGRSINPSDRLIAWDFDKSIEATHDLKVPTYSVEITKDSGVAPTFQVISVFGPTYTGAKVAQLFDKDATTNVSSLTGDGFILEFDRNVTFSRAEFVRNFSTDYTVTITASLDNITYYPAVELVGGYLTKHSSEYDLDGDNTVDKVTDPFVAKYLRFDITHSGSRSITELRLYGYHTTGGKTHSGGNGQSSQRANKEIEAVPGLPFIEKFDSLHEGDIPVGWRRGGDWDWGAQASGIYARENPLPSTPLGNGKVKVGQFAGNSIGNGDGFALRTQTNMPTNSSGIIEVDIEVGNNELTENDTAGRTIKFDIRHFLIGVGDLIAPPEDDRIRFFVVPEFGDPLDGEVDFNQQGSFIHVADWHTVSTDVSPGNYTLKWIYFRGDTPVVSPFPKEEPVAWIDNIRGLEGGASDSSPGGGAGTGGLLPLTINGVLFCQNVIEESINGYIQNPYNSWITAYMFGGNPFQPINSFIVGAPDAFDSINGYLLGMRQGEVYGYTLGGEGLRSFPTGIINGYIATNSGVKAPSVNGYLLGMKQGQIHGYLSSLGDGTGVINSYLNSDYHFSTVLGRLGPSGNALSEQVFGYLPARTFESINAYMNNAGATTKVFGYMSPQKSSFVNAYLTTPSESGNIQIYGYLANSGIVAPAVNAWISGASIFTPINGYLINQGAFTEVNGYLNVQDDAKVNGFLHGRDLLSEQVNAYISGIGFKNTEVNGYIFGVSGIINENINGYMIGNDIDTEMVDGYLTGYEEVCVAHGVPLPTVPTGIIIPTNCFNFGV